MTRRHPASPAISSPFRHTLAALLLVGTIFSAEASATTYNIVELPLPPTAVGGQALGINAMGDVVGYVDSFNGRDYATAWVAPDQSARVLQDGDFDSKSSQALGINDRGYIVGELWPRKQQGSESVVWKLDGSFVTQLKGWPGQLWSDANDINARNTVVGSFVPGDDSGYRPAIWFAPGKIQWLGAAKPDFREGVAYAANDSGTVVGYGHVIGGNDSHAFRWTLAGGMQDLGDLPGGNDFSIAYDVNETGQIVGHGSSEAGGRAVMWNADGSMQDLGTVSGDTGLYYDAFDINNLGVVIGRTSGSEVIFLWTAGSGMLRIVDVIDPYDPWYQRLRSGDANLSVYDLNDAGVIVGSLYKGGGITVPVMLVPQSCAGGPDPQVTSPHRGAIAAMQGTGCL